MHIVRLRMFKETDCDASWKAMSTRYGVKVSSTRHGELTLFFRELDNPVQELPRHLQPINLAHFVRSVLPPTFVEDGIDRVVVNDEHEYDWPALVALETRIISGEIKVPSRQLYVPGDGQARTVN